MKIVDGRLLSVDPDKDIIDESIIIPNNVTSIAIGSCYNCDSFRNIYYTGDINQWVQIEGLEYLMHKGLFPKKLYIQGKLLVTANIDTATNINNSAFYNCTSLKSVTMNNNVTRIGTEAFFRCTSLVNVAVSDSVTIIGYSAFEYCISLPHIIISNNATIIGATAFAGCINLQNIVIPHSVKNIGYNAFYNCESLKNIYYTGDINQWVQINGVQAVMMSNKFPKNLYIQGQLLTTANIDTATKINSYALCNCNSLTDIIIGKNVTGIGGGAFYNCGLLNKEDDKYYYKAFEPNLTCRDFQYEEDKWFTYTGKIKLCKSGFHACKNVFDLFNYYSGTLNEDVIVYKVELKGISKEKNEDSKVVAKKIRLVERINSYAELLNQ